LKDLARSKNVDTENNLLLQIAGDQTGLEQVRVNDIYRHEKVDQSNGDCWMLVILFII